MSNVDLALTTEETEENPVLGDLRIDGTEIGIVRDTADAADATAQEVGVVLRWWRGEFFLDTRKGVPYLDQILVKGVSEATVREILRAQILTVPSIARVMQIDVSIDRVSRLGEVTFDATLTSGMTLTPTTVPLGEVR